MRLEITTGGQKQAVVLEGKGTVGGGDDDLVRVAGAPPKLVELWPEGPVWRIKTRVPGKVNGVAFPAHIGRVFCAGETVDLGGGTMLLVHVAESGNVGTAAVLKDFLTDPKQARPSLPVLVCLTGADSGRRFSMVGTEALLGRGERCEVQLRDGSVSRKHARISKEGSKFWIEDLDSPNGVYLNSRRISRRAVLADGVVIEVGQTLLRFQLPADEAPAPASAVSPTPSTTPIVPVAKEPPPKLSLVEPELAIDEVETEPEPDPEPEVVAVNEPEAEQPRLGLQDKALIAAGLALMLLGGGAAFLLS